MNLQDLLQAIDECDNRLLTFNRGYTTSFLYKNKWYPVKATVERVIGGCNTSQATVELTKTLDYVRIKSVNFTTNLPVTLNDTDIKEEAKKITKILNELLE